MTPEDRLWQEAWDHINRTGKASVAPKDPSKPDQGFNCVYQGSGCAFTPAILPKHLSDCEGANASKLLEQYEDWLHEWVRECDPDFADSIQECHDVCAVGEDGRGVAEKELFLSTFRQEMMVLARAYGIDTGGRCA
jgi:hypothetical protein